ncbi:MULTISPECIES: peptidase dimerization domain-containing protein [unclassified Mesorhizobium]|uniref:peptidase dimerization domain-containing protein n=1 Tax=unclassified Mesorhizobium TaxID=325217 RepID=UPI00333933E5
MSDNKGQHFAQILAIESHLKVHGALPCNVILLLEGEEEIGSPHIADFVRVSTEALKADFAVKADGARHASGAPVIKFGSRGVLSFGLRCRHANGDLHSGNFGGVVPNPIWTLVHFLGTMKNAEGKITIDGFHDGIEPSSREELAAIERLPLDVEVYKQSLGLLRLDAPAALPFYERLCFRPTLTINGFHGGYGGPGSKTVLPSEAFVKFDVRLVDAQDPGDILRKVAAHVEKHAPDVELIAMENMPPSKTPIASPFAAPLRRAFVAAQGQRKGRSPCLSLRVLVACRAMSSPRYSAFLLSIRHTRTMMKQTTRRMKIDHLIASTAGFAQALHCYMSLARCDLVNLNRLA